METLLYFFRLNRQRENQKFSPAAGLREERWIPTLCEARNKNEAWHLGFYKPKSLGLGSWLLTNIFDQEIHARPYTTAIGGALHGALYSIF